MDLRTTDALKAAANAWPGGRELLVTGGNRLYSTAQVVINHDGTVVIRLLTSEEVKHEAALTEMNTDPITGSTEHPVDESIPALEMPGGEYAVEFAEKGIIKVDLGE